MRPPGTVTAITLGIPEAALLSALGPIWAGAPFMGSYVAGALFGLLIIRVPETRRPARDVIPSFVITLGMWIPTDVLVLHFPPPTAAVVILGLAIGFFPGFLVMALVKYFAQRPTPPSS